MTNRFLYSYKSTSVFYFVVVLANIVLLGSYLNLLLTILQYILVLWTIRRRNINEAIFLHFSFIMTSIAPTSLLSAIDNVSIPLMSYARVKIGPVCFHYLISFFLLAITAKKHILMNRRTLFFKLFIIFMVLAVTGAFLGLFGFLFDDYYEFSGVLLYGTYMIIVLINMYILIKNHSPELQTLFYNSLPPILGSGILATAFAYFILGISGAYADLNMVLQPEIVYFGIIFFLGYFESRYKKYVLIVSIIYIAINLIGASGHMILVIAIGLLYFLYYTYFSSEYKSNYPKLIKRSRKIFIILIPLIVVFLLVAVDIGDLFIIKLNNVFSLFSTNLDDVGTSPYVRIATTMNIWDNNIHNPIGLLFGQGYGGYFTDSLHMFDGLGDLTDGGWPEKDVQTGRFTRGHDTTAVVPLLHGFGGLAILLWICFKYAKFTGRSYMAYAIYPWIIFTFYYNIQYAIIGIAFLYASEIVDSTQSNKKRNNQIKNKSGDDKGLLFYEQRC